jgi:hypothetical protein
MNNRIEVGDKVFFNGRYSTFLSERFPSHRIGTVIDCLCYGTDPDSTIVKVKYEDENSGNAFLAGRETDFRLVERLENTENLEKTENNKKVEKEEIKYPSIKFEQISKNEMAVTFVNKNGEKEAINLSPSEDCKYLSREDFLNCVSFGLEFFFPGFFERDEDEDEDCCDNCTCDEECDCDDSCNCSDCKALKEKKKPYTGKVCFMGETSRNYTRGKIYEVYDGITVDEQGQCVYFIFDDAGNLITSFEELNAIMPHKWIEVIDEQESKLSKFYSGKVLCIAGSDVEGFTAGKVYEIVCGALETDRGVAVTYANNLFESVEQINKYCIAQFMEITE